MHISQGLHSYFESTSKLQNALIAPSNSEVCVATKFGRSLLPASPLDSKSYIHLYNFFLQMENLEPISQSGVSTTSKILRMLLGLKQKSSTKIVKGFMDGLAWEVLSCNGIRNYKLDLLLYQHTSTLLNLSVKEVLYFNKLSKTVLQKIQCNYYRKAIKH